MKIVVCQWCGELAEWETCIKIYGKKDDYYGEYTQCPHCGNCLYQQEVSKVKTKFVTD